MQRAYMTEDKHRVGPGEHECSFRTISAETHLDEQAPHPAGGVDSARIEAERLMSVLDRARMLVESECFGRLSPRHLSLSGAVIAASLLIKETMNTALRQLADDH